ncbi:MAG: hypothetical protein M3391_02770 [Actinomycetota bacterium]|nr:hypothetical protein [Actinomycetota bacterium]
MDISIAASRRTWVPLVAVVMLATIGVAAYALTRREGSPGHRSGTPADGPVILEQAPWRIQTFATGIISKLTKVEKARLRKQRQPLTGLVKELHSALFLDPSTRKRVVRRFFAASAASSFLAARPGITARAETVRTMRRSGRIGIQADSARRAAGTVIVKARVEGDRDAVRIDYRSDLFLEKKHGRWKVVAFETVQRPLPEWKERKKASRGRNGKDRKGGDKKGGDKKGDSK